MPHHRLLRHLGSGLPYQRSYFLRKTLFIQSRYPMAKGKDIQAIALNYYYGKDLNSHAKDGFLETKVRVDRASSIPWLKTAHWRGEIKRISQIISKEGQSNTTLFAIS